jgi:hypothetical protein
VKATAERDGWIPGPLQPDISCPLSDAEVRQLYATNGALTPTDEVHLLVQHPELAKLLTVSGFYQLAAEQAKAESGAKLHRRELWDKPVRQGLTAVHLRQMHRKVQTAAMVLGEEQH